MTTAATPVEMDVWTIMGDYLPSDRWSQLVRHLVPPNDNGDKEWSRVMEEVWMSPGFPELCDRIRETGFEGMVVSVGGGKVIAGTRIVVAAAKVGERDGIPVLEVDAA